VRPNNQAGAILPDIIECSELRPSNRGDFDVYMKSSLLRAVEKKRQQGLFAARQ
jgi:hypothetical protein